MVVLREVIIAVVGVAAVAAEVEVLLDNPQMVKIDLCAVTHVEFGIMSRVTAQKPKHI